MPERTCFYLSTFVQTMYYPSLRPALFVLSLLLSGSALAQQRFTLSGTITDRSSGEALIGATVQELYSKKGVSANTYGFYSLTIPAADSILLSVSYVGYKPLLLKTALQANQRLDLSLELASVLKEVEIVGQRYERIEERAQMSRIDIPIEQIKNVPALLGEKDVLRALQLLPGVSGGGEGQSGIYVRGGGPDQNLILLDGVPVYNASHLFGFFSVFNADAIKDVSLIKGGFPARYGGRLSSVIEINMKEGNENEFHGEGSIGIVASKLTLEGPIKKGRSSFIVSGRRTYIDLLARPIIKSAFRSDGGEGVAGYFFDDVNAKVNYRLSNKDRLYLSFYGGNDDFYLRFTEKSGSANSVNRYEDKFSNGLGWGNRTAALRWNHVFSPKLFANTTATFSRYKFETDFAYTSRYFENNVQTESEDFVLNYLSGIRDWAVKMDFDYVPDPAHYVRFGANVIYHTFQPGQFRSRIESISPNDSSKINTNFIEPNVFATEFAAYAEDDWKVTDRLRVNAGLHFSGFAQKGQPYFSLQPRLNARYLFAGNWSLKAGFSTMQQYIHLLTNETIGLPTDLWLPSTDKIKPQRSWQVALGAAKTFNKEYECSIELFYKEMDNVIAFNEGASAFEFQNWEDRVSQGLGTAYGAEFFIQKKKGKFTGWVGYTLSWAWRQFDNINFGERYPYKYDRRHDFEITGAYKFNKRVSLAATWVYATGNAVTFANSRYIGPQPYDSFAPFLYEQEHTPERNNFRMPAYHRLDFGIDFTKQKRRYSRTWSFGAYNGYSRANPFFLFRDSNVSFNPDGTTTRTEVLKKAALFPIVPYFNWSFKF
ncbi:MAG: TonB-dependent receptor [Chitinophagales bacterium]|nr:TonB-dependent receptor [Chitinophagales bacterium]